MFAEETIFCIWLSCAYKQSRVQFKKKKKRPLHIRGSPLYCRLSWKECSRTAQEAGRVRGWEGWVAAPEKSLRAIALAASTTASCRHHCSPKGIFLRSRLTILVHNWIIFLFFETTVCVPDHVKCTGVRHTEYFIEMNSSVCSLRETAFRYPNIILMMDCKVIFPASSVN